MKGCKSCKPFSVLNTLTNKCECIKGYYYSAISDSCAKCHPLCNTCFGPKNTDCSSCIKNATFIDDLNTCNCEKNMQFDKTSCSCYYLPISLEKKEDNITESDNFIPNFDNLKNSSTSISDENDFIKTKSVKYQSNYNKKTDKISSDETGYIKTKSVKYKGNLNKKMNENDESYTEAKDLTKVYYEHLPMFKRLEDKFCDKGFKLNNHTDECLSNFQ